MRPDGSWAAAERAMVSRARWRVTLLVAGIGTLLVVLAGAVAYAVLVRGQQHQADGALWYAAEHGSPDDPDGCVWLFVQAPGRAVASSAGAPGGFPLPALLTEARDTRRVLRSDVDRDGTVYRVRTQRRGDEVVQAVFDTRFQLADRRLLLDVLIAVELAGLLGGAVAGAVVGRRIVAPLGEALSRQRRFVVDASHELRGPIAQLHIRAQLIARRAARGQPPAEQRAELDRLIGTTRALGEVVEDVLSSASPGERAFELVDLTACAEAAVAAEADRARQGGVTLTVHRPPAPVLVPGVPSALRRVVRELVSNALAHTPAGGLVLVQVRWCPRLPERSRRWERQAELVVRDDGEGFDQAQAERIFERFRRGTGDGSGHGWGHGSGTGFGLGLALVREVVAAHGGGIEASGSPGGGARFAVRLPAPAGLPQPARSGSSPSPAEASPSAASTAAVAGGSGGRP